MLTTGQLITSIKAVFYLSKDAKENGIRLVHTPRTIDDDIMDLNHELKVLHQDRPTGYIIQIGLDVASLDYFDGTALHEVAILDMTQETPIRNFTATVINAVMQMKEKSTK